MKKKKLLIENPELIISDIYYSQTSSTFLVAFVGVFMVLVSFLGNTGVNAFNLPIKSSVLENMITPQTPAKPNILDNITIGKQTIIIGGKEYTLELSPKY